MSIVIRRNPYVRGFYFNAGRWAIITRHIVINAGYFV